MFFTAINQMMTEGVDLTLVIRKANGQMAVSVLPKSNGLKDEAQNHIIPLTLKGVPQELDTGFLQAVARPVQKATGLITNMAQFEAQTEKAASESKAAKDAKAKETKEEKEKREKYEKHLKKAEELIAAGNHKDAVTALGQARLYAKPQDQKKIDEMLEQQKKAMNRGSLFELMEERLRRNSFGHNHRQQRHNSCSLHRTVHRNPRHQDRRADKFLTGSSRQCGRHSSLRKGRHRIRLPHSRNTPDNGR